MPSITELERHRTALRGHCYRMLASAVDADDAVQETIVRAWRNLDGFDGRSTLLTWMYRIATNVCLDTLEQRTRRERPVLAGPMCTIDDALVERAREAWVEPIADREVLPDDIGPAELVTLRQSVRLAFVAALQYLPAKQRVALLLMDVLDWSAAETADCLGTTIASVNSALQRARATLAATNVEPAPATLSDGQTNLVARYVEAFERYDIDALTSLLHEDATLSMPPYTLWLRGHTPIKHWLLGRGIGCRGSKLLPTAANGLPAFGQYRPGECGAPHKAWSLVVLETKEDRVVAMNHFLDVSALFPQFGLPLVLAD